MLAFLFGLVSCVFVPYNISSMISFDRVNSAELSDIVSKNPIVVVLSCPQDNYVISHAFTNSESLFPEAVFAIADKGALKDYLKQKVPAEPSIAIFKKGSLDVIVGSIYKENTLLYIIDLYLYEKRPVLKSSAEVIAALGETPVTIITTEKEFDHTFSITKKSLTNSEPINIVSLSAKAAEEISLVPGYCAIFRSLDQVLDSARCNAEDIKTVIKPVFQNAKIELLQESKKPSVVFHPTDHNSHEVKDFMYKLGSNFKDFNFFFVNDKEACKLVDKYYPPSFCSKNQIGVIDFKANIAYNVSSIINTEELKESFDSKKMTANVSHLIYQIRNHAVPHYYMSEQIPKSSNAPLKRIVGLNYKELVVDNDDDVLVLFLKPRDSDCSKAFNKLRKIADDALEDCHKDDEKENETSTANTKTNKTQICNIDLNNHTKFYFIISTDNKIEGGYPTFPGEPSLVLYSALDKSKPRLVIGSDLADIQLHLKLFAKYPVTFNKKYTIGSMEHFNEQAEIAKSVRARMTVEEVELLMDTIDKVGAEFKERNEDINEELDDNEGVEL